jgi:hypothetical protein
MLTLLANGHTGTRCRIVSGTVEPCLDRGRKQDLIGRGLVDGANNDGSSEPVLARK